MIDWQLLFESLSQLIFGARLTLFIASAASILGLTLGTLFAFGQDSKNLILRGLVTLYINVVRGTPMLIQIGFIYYVILPMLQLSWSALAAATVAIGLNSAAYMSQTIKAGIFSVSKGQIEAGKSLGLTRLQIISSIILPQAFRVVLPALGNEFITLIKDSSLASVIGVVELYKEGLRIISVTFDALTIYTGIALVYLSLTIPLSLLVNYFERKLVYHA